MFKKFIAQQIADKVSDIPDSASIGDASAFAEEVILAIETAQEQHLGKYAEAPNDASENSEGVI